MSLDSPMPWLVLLQILWNTVRLSGSGMVALASRSAAGVAALGRQRQSGGLRGPFFLTPQ
ncbi:hypothetical protein [Xanthobacter autotrophicus]|jgi:hypothetical protein|uniref:hypothetical protein n=1 Tax=Xanthobacter autotrophicus TaxID=280 RepID=UPI00372CA7F5